MITKKNIADTLLSYLHHNITLSELVSWCENQILSGGYESGYEDVIRNSLGRLAAADVQSFGLLWEDCEEIMSLLGYKLNIDAALVA
jgi:5-formaminoimidazole-4-carboxamide-1-beta-D-ribofuranosyl 5'-monophosphate synthetase